MSLTVSPELLRKAEQGQVSNEDFVQCIRTSLPFAYNMVETLSKRLETGETDPGKVFARNVTEPKTENERGQVLRLMASDSMRSAMEQQFGMRLAFQNCHSVAVFPTDSSADQALAMYTSARAQLLNQSPELVNC